MGENTFVSPRAIALRIRRAETPFYARLKGCIKLLLTFRLPAPRFFFPALRAIYAFRFAAPEVFRRLMVVFFREPLFRSTCEHVGKRLRLERLPSISGHARIRIGDDVYISGSLSIASGRMLDNPELSIGNNVFLGHGTTIKASRRVVIEDGVLVAQGCYIADSDDHPLDRKSRMEGAPALVEKIKPVHIGRGAWLGRGCYVLKGVTIGEGAVIGAASVVTTDVPPFSVAVGNPARVIRQIEPS
jgi:acetyltransferase-like isoleucine patch superfamily enzyme